MKFEGSHVWSVQPIRIQPPSVAAARDWTPDWMPWSSRQRSSKVEALADPPLDPSFIDLGLPLAKVLCYGLAAVAENPLAQSMDLNLRANENAKVDIDAPIVGDHSFGASNALDNLLSKKGDDTDLYEFQGLVPMINDGVNMVMPNLRGDFQRQHDEMLAHIEEARVWRDQTLTDAGKAAPCHQSVRWVMQNLLDIFASEASIACSPPPLPPAPLEAPSPPADSESGGFPFIFG